MPTALMQRLCSIKAYTLVKSGIVQIDAAPFKQWYEQFYGVKIGTKKKVKTCP